jgi:hypothetical protein
LFNVYRNWHPRALEDSSLSATFRGAAGGESHIDHIYSTETGRVRYQEARVRTAELPTDHRQVEAHLCPPGMTPPAQPTTRKWRDPTAENTENFRLSAEEAVSLGRAIAAEKGKLLIQAFVCDVLTPVANRALQPVARQGAAATGPETEEAAHLRAQWFRLKEDLRAAKNIPAERARGDKGLVVRERAARKEWRACLRREEQEAVRVL